MIPDRIQFLGCPLDRIAPADILALARARLANGPPLVIEGLNVFKLIEARRDPPLYASLAKAGLVHIDGAGIALGGRLLGAKLPPRRAGIDLMADLLTLCSETGASVYLLGAKESVLAQTVAAFRSQWPQLVIAGARDGYFSAEQGPAIAAAIAASGAGLLLVGMSSPKKELFIGAQMAACGAKVALGVGGSFDVYAGVVDRAPLWMQRAGLEWFFRLISEPRRLWWRYLHSNTAFGWLLLRALVDRRRR